MTENSNDFSGVDDEPRADAVGTGLATDANCTTEAR
jgi:hypothetical protein